MNNHIQLFLAFIGIIIALGAWLFPIKEKQLTDRIVKKEINQNYEDLRKANLIISGTNLDVDIKKGKYFYSGGELNSINSKTTIFINENQQLILHIKGINIDLFIDKSIRENIVINNNGLNLKIKEI